MNLVDVLNDMKAIYGFCPCCGELFRLSDATLFTKTRPPVTPFDRVDASLRKFQGQAERFEEREEAVRDAARVAGQRAARKRLRRLAPFFVSRDVVPEDVKVLFHPVEYLVFRGLGDGNCNSLLFIDHTAESRERERLQQSLLKALQSGNVAWETFRITPEGQVVREEAPGRRKRVT